MSKMAQQFPHLSTWAEHHDTLGWDNFLEGRISKQFFQLQGTYMKDTGSKQNIRTWAVSFITRVLHITHQQWLYRNMRLHIRLVEGKTEAEHELIRKQVEDMILTTDSDLLPHHRHLLHCDFLKLGAGTTTDRQYWLADMHSARQAAGCLADSTIRGR